jgi:hypothetical protein
MQISQRMEKSRAQVGRALDFSPQSGSKLPEFDEHGRRLYFRECDLLARLWLNSMALPEFDAKNFEGCSILIHAERYLADRLSYELAPWPSGCINLETEHDYILPREIERNQSNDSAMLKYRDGHWYVFQEATTKPFERFRIDASRGLIIGLQAFFVMHECGDGHVII